MNNYVKICINNKKEEIMERIYLDGKERTEQIVDWRLWNKKETKQLMMTLVYRSGKTYTADYNRCKVKPTKKVNGNLLTKLNTNNVSCIDFAIEVGTKYTIIKYPKSEVLYAMKNDKIKLEKATNLHNEDVFKYFVSIAKERFNDALTSDKKIMTKNIIEQLSKVISHKDTVLHAYCYGEFQAREKKEELIFPFGLNDSQLLAIENAFSSQISVIEGPPGTGKTQTILNIIANILVDKKTVAIVSNNNPAVENVYEKLKKNDLDYIVAKLGNSGNKDKFFETIKNRNDEFISENMDIDSITTLVKNIRQYLVKKNRLAEVVAIKQEVAIEKEYLEDWKRTNHISDDTSIINRYKLKPNKLAELMAYLHFLSYKHFTFIDKMRLLVRFRIFNSEFLNDMEERNQFIYALQSSYYINRLKEIEKEEKQLQHVLKKNNYDDMLNKLEINSMLFLKQELKKNISGATSNYNSKNYQKDFNGFLKRFPVIGSSTHSIVNSIGSGYILDYIIIDEASQQDIVPGILSLGCAKNIIVVGDTKQLPHIPTKTKIVCPIEEYDCTKYSLLDSFVKVFKGKVPITLLKEHYRCHPKIIQFCNKQFYHNELIPMKMDYGEKALSMITTSKGNHTRSFTNLRELESIQKVGIGFEGDTGFIAPYNKQVNLSEEYLPYDVTKATIHKFQGRECKEIVFSTVLDKKQSSQRMINFVDDPCLVNVAVSRAIENFTLVTGDNVFTKNNKSIAALIRYINYYADEKELHQSPVISAFDLLYAEYDKSLTKLAKRLNPKDSRYQSEQIATLLLHDILIKDRFSSLLLHKQILLIQLVSFGQNNFTSRELKFMKDRSSCDFVLYYKVGKHPVAVIEIDGYAYHTKPKQIEFDELKNKILEKANLPLLRLSTIEGNIKEKIEEFLLNVLDNNQ